MNLQLIMGLHCSEICSRNYISQHHHIIISPKKLDKDFAPTPGHRPDVDSSKVFDSHQSLENNCVILFRKIHGSRGIAIIPNFTQNHGQKQVTDTELLILYTQYHISDD